MHPSHADALCDIAAIVVFLMQPLYSQRNEVMLMSIEISLLLLWCAGVGYTLAESVTGVM